MVCFQAFYVNQTCVFWNFSTSSWSTDGCSLVASSVPPQCLCDHLTNFAVLIVSVFSAKFELACLKSNMYGMYFLFNKQIRECAKHSFCETYEKVSSI